MSEIDQRCIKAFTIDETEGTFLKLSVGTVYPPNAFESEKTFVINGNDPLNIMRAFHEMIKPAELLSSEPTPIEKDFKPENLEISLNKMTSKDIIEKVLSETGIKININLKSKKSIINKALKIYREFKMY